MEGLMMRAAALLDGLIRAALIYLVVSLSVTLSQAEVDPRLVKVLKHAQQAALDSQQLKQLKGTLTIATEQ